MPASSPLEALFLDHLDHIDRIVASVCRRHSLTGDSASDFASWVRLRLVEGDYGILRKFRGESSLVTYLAVVVAMLFREYRVQRWGRWRPSAAAKRRGTVAVRLETLTRRDGLNLDQAAQVLRTAGTTTLSDRELAALLQELPPRSRPRPIDVGDAELNDILASTLADDVVMAAESAAQRQALCQALTKALQRLSAEDNVILRMRFWEGLSVADIARALGARQKPLYRRIESMLTQLRKNVEEAGISRDDANVLLGDVVS